MFRKLGYDAQGRPQYAYLHLEGPPQNVGGGLAAVGRAVDGNAPTNGQLSAPLFNSEHMPWTSLNENRKARRPYPEIFGIFGKFFVIFKFTDFAKYSFEVTLTINVPLL